MSLSNMKPTVMEGNVARELGRLMEDGVRIVADLSAGEAWALIAASQIFYSDYLMGRDTRLDTYCAGTKLCRLLGPHSDDLAQVADQFWMRHLSRLRDRDGVRELFAVQDVLFIQSPIEIPMISIEGVAAIYTNGSEPNEATSTISFERPMTFKEEDWRYEQLTYTFSDRRIVLHAWIDMMISADEMMVMFSPIAIQLPVPAPGQPRPPMTPWD